MLTGNPVRPAIAAHARTAVYVAARRDAIALLVLGGSLGARVFSDVVPAAVARLPEALRRRLVGGAAMPARRISSGCAPPMPRLGIAAELAAFFPDVAERLPAAHLVIARAGASTVAELAVAGRPAILVPLPGAIDDHQSANARALARRRRRLGGAAAAVHARRAAPSSSPRCSDDRDALRDAAAGCGVRGDGRNAAPLLADLVESRIMSRRRAR